MLTAVTITISKTQNDKMAIITSSASLYVQLASYFVKQEPINVLSINAMCLKLAGRL
jgi:hypothetical protein